MKKGTNNITDGLFWSFSERIFAQLVSTLVTIILARLLDPEHYGIISIVTVFISLCNIFVTSGFGKAIVRKKNATDSDFNNAFSLSLMISIILYILLFICSPSIAKFYNMSELTLVLRVMGIRIILASLNSIQQSVIQREMKFKKFFISTSIGTIISAIVGVLCALFGFGVWALVFQYLSNTTIDTIALQVIGNWKPKIEFSKEKIREIFSFGWKVLVTDLIFTLEADIRSLIIGKVFGSADLAFYDQGKKYPALLVTNINSSINKVMLPAYSKEQENIEKLKDMLRKSIRVGLYILVPILIGFSSVASIFVSLVLTNKWMPSVIYIQIFCFAYLIRPLEASCHQSLLALGKSDIVLKLMTIINLFSLFAVVIAVFIFHSVLLIAICSLLSSIVSVICFMVSTNKYVNYRYKEQLSDIMPTLIIGLIMGLFVKMVGFLNINAIVILVLQIILGVLIYIFLSYITNNVAFVYLKQKILKRA